MPFIPNFGRHILQRSLPLVLVLPICLSPFLVSADERAGRFNELEKVILSELKQTRTPGAAIAIVSGDRVAFAKGFGVANVEIAAPPTPDMLFRIASVTKMFTATALVTLAEQGKCKLDEPIARYATALNPGLSQVTVHQLLTHTAGLVDDSERHGRHDESALTDWVRSWTQQYFFTEPGEIYSYSSPGFVLAGYVIQEISGKPYAEAMNELLFKPLGMSRTTFRPTMAMTFPLAIGHAVNQSGTTVVRPFTDDTRRWPAGYMFSSVNDLARFAIAFLNDGRLGDKQALSSSVIAKLSTPYADTHLATGNWKQGYGMRVGNYRGVRFVEHLGGTPGFGAVIRMAPEHRFAVIILANNSLAQLDKTVEKAMELMLPLQPKPEAKSKVSIPMNDVEMDRYAGTYANGGLRLEIVNKSGRLYLVADGEAPLIKTGENVLSIAEATAAPELLSLFQNLVLVPGVNGRPEYLYFGGRALKRVEAAP